MRLHKALFLLIVMTSAPSCFAQSVNNASNSGTPENGLFHGGEVDSVQQGNGNLHIEFPLFTVAGRGLPYQSFFVLDTKQWYAKITTQKSTGLVIATIQPEPNGTPFGIFNTNFGYKVTFNHNPGSSSCLSGIGWPYNGIVREPNGTKHHLVPDVGASNPQCQLPSQFYADDGSGFAGFTAGAFTKDGTSIGGTSGFLTDTNGNQITQPSPPTGSYVDTLGRQFPWPGTYQYYDSSGTLQTIQYTTVSVPVQTNLCQFYLSQVDQCNEATGNRNLLSSITLPDGAKYSFTYVQNDMGEPSSMTLPSGATISWTYGNLDQSGIYVTSRKVAANGQNNTWTYGYVYDGSTGTYQVSNIVDPLGNETDFTWQDFLTNYANVFYLPFVTLKKFNDKSSGTSVLVRTEQTDYSTSNGPVLPIRVTTTWNQTNQVSKVETDYDSFTGISGTLGLTFSAGNPIAKREYDWGSGAPGNLLRNTLFNYLHRTNSTYLNRNIADRVTSKTVYDSMSNTCKGLAQACAQTTYTYDSTSITGTSGAPNHDYSGHGSTFTTRGNLTVTCRVLIPGNSCLNTTNTYNDLGDLLSTTDPAGNVTSFSYADNFTDGTNRNAQAFVTQTTHPATNGVNHIEKKQYFYYSSLVAASCGQNFSAACSNSLNPPQPDYAKSTYDSMFRPLTVTRGDGGSATYSYNDTTLPLSATASTAINSSTNKTVTTIFDDLDRVKETQLTSDPQGTIYTDTAYDALGRVATASNPYRAGGDITTSTGTTTYFYDALGRKCLEVGPDGTQPGSGVSCPATQPANDLFTVYSGNTTTVTDQTGKSRKSVTDGLGRATQVFEDPAGLDYETDYSFDALGNLLTVNQKGGSSNSALWRTRTFSYDSLSRLLTSNNPEVGTITYKYDSDSNCASPNSFPDLLVSKTDARGIRTCSQFDALDRQTVRNYSNGDPTITTSYDQSNCLGLASCQNIGHRTSMTDAAGSEAWSFDVVDRIHRDQRTTSSVTKTTTYNLDYAGNTVQATYPTNRVVNYTFDAANRPSSVQDASNGITYATGFQTSPGGTCLNNVTCYTPQGTFYALSIGQTSSFSGLNLTHIYNSRLQPQEFKASSTGGNAIDISYSFLDSSGHNSGHVYAITNNLDGTRSQTFSYDSLNRLTGALTASTYSTSHAHCWGESYSVDPWGNLNTIAGTSNSNYTGCSQESGFSTTADGNNHLPILGYDPSGNTTSDGFVTNYQWDGESQLKSAAGVNYLYDGDGRRISKSNGKLYWYDGGGEILAETDASGYTQNEYIFFGGKRIAIAPLGGKPMFYVEDMLGTSRVLTSGSSTRIQSSGGTNTWKYYYTGLCPGISGTTYTISVLIKNQGTASMYIGGNIVSGPVIAPGTTQQVNFTEVGNGVSCIQFGLVTLNTGDPMDVLAYAPVISVGGTNLIPTASQDFSGWSAYQGASVTITQGQPPQVVYDADFYPYGGERAYVSIFPQNYKFEGKERDTETGNDEFGARYYSNRFGRWLSADWSSVPVPVPYANLTNPQTLNLYAMVSDDPESFADLDGHQEADPERDREEEVREEAELKEVFERLEAAREAREAKEAAESAEAFRKFVDERGGWDNPLTGVCYAPSPTADEPTIGPAPRPGYRPGTLGDANHQRTANEEAAKMDPKGETEVRINTPGGKKGFRKVDATNLRKGGKDIVQVIRPNKNGTAPKRENDASADVQNATRIKPRFVPVRPGPKPKPKPPGYQ